MSNQPSLFENNKSSELSTQNSVLSTQHPALSSRIFIGLDIEATGLDPKNEKIIEIAIVKFDDEKIIDTYTTLINPEKEIPPEITKLTGIKDQDLSSAPKLEEVKDKIIEFIGPYPILGHFIEFDINFLNEHGFNLTNKQLDTYELAKILLENEASYNLEILGQKFGIIHENAHRAYDDTIACIELLKVLQKNIENLTPNILLQIQEIIKKSAFPWAEEFAYQFSKKTDQGIDPLLRETEINNDASEISKIVNGKNFRIPRKQNQIEIIDSPSSYFCEEKFNDFLKKESFSREEACFVIKMLIFLNKFKGNKTVEPNLISKTQVRLDGQEKSFWSSISYQLEDFLNTELWKSKNNLDEINISNDFILDLIFSEKNYLNKQKKLIIEDIGEFIKNTLKNLCNVITLNRLNFYQKNNDIKEKYAMLFGLMGLFFDKVFNEARGENELNASHLQEQSFLQLKNLAYNIKSNFELSIIEEKLLTDIFEIDFNNYIYTLTKTDKEDIIFKKYPTNINEKINRINAFFENIEVNSPFPLSINESAYIKKIIGDFTLINNEIEKAELYSTDIESIVNELDEPNKDLIILSTSDSNIKNLILQIEECASNEIFILSPLQKLSMGRMEHFWQRNEDKKRIIIARFQYFNNFINNPNNKFKENINLLIDVIPFENVKSIISRIISRNYRNFFIEYIVPKATLDLKNTIFTFLESNSSNKKILIRDYRINSYDGEILKNLSNMINFYNQSS